MFETGLPWWVPAPGEIHAFGFGLIHSFSRKQFVKLDDIEKEDYSPEIEYELKEKHHYYVTGFYLPRFLILGVIAWRLVILTDILNSAPALTQIAHLILGV